jgi:Phage major capsid protein E
MPLVYPTSAEIMAIAQDLMPRLQADRPIFDIMPVRNVDEYVLIWEQYANFTGLQAARGLNGEPPYVNKPALNRLEIRPGAYGEKIRTDELELTRRRIPGNFGAAIDISDMILMNQNHLLVRRLDRIEWIGWNLLIYGTYTTVSPQGVTIATDSSATQVYTSTVPWSTSATATPLADFRAVKLLHRGHSVSFGTKARAFCSQQTLNQALINTNNADLYGRRVTGLAVVNNQGDFNKLLAGDDLPSIEVYDEGYLDYTGAFQLFIPLGSVLVVGKRPAGQRLCEYRMTRNANNVDMAPGPYMRVIDKGEQDIPRDIDVHDGHNGGPVIFFGNAIVSMIVDTSLPAQVGQGWTG